MEIPNGFDTKSVLKVSTHIYKDKTFYCKNSESSEYWSTELDGNLLFNSERVKSDVLCKIKLKFINGYIIRHSQPRSEINQQQVMFLSSDNKSQYSASTEYSSCGEL